MSHSGLDDTPVAHRINGRHGRRSWRGRQLRIVPRTLLPPLEPAKLSSPPSASPETRRRHRRCTPKPGFQIRWRDTPPEELNGALRLLRVYERYGQLSAEEAAEWRGRIAAWRIFHKCLRSQNEVPAA